MENRFYVYGLYKSLDDSIFDRCFYIGKGCRDRLDRHFRPSYNHVNLHKKRIIENSENAYSRKIYRGLSESKALELEKFLIREIGLDNLSNLILGDNCFGFLDRSGENNPMYGKTHSDETRRRMSESSSGKQKSEEHRNKLSESNSHENSPVAKLSRKDAREVKWISKNTDLTNLEVGSIYGVSASTVSGIKNNTTWKGINPKQPNIKKYEPPNR